MMAHSSGCKLTTEAQTCSTHVKASITSAAAGAVHDPAVTPFKMDPLLSTHEMRAAANAIVAGIAELVSHGSPEDGQHSRSSLLADSSLLVVQPHRHSRQALHIDCLQRMCIFQCSICIIQGSNCSCSHSTEQHCRACTCTRCALTQLRLR